MLTLDQKRAMEAKVTAAFLRDNPAPVKEIVRRFATELRARLPIQYRFYLKGGNAISLLREEATTGDFDFQVVPPITAYDDWHGAFQDFDPTIIISLKEALNAITDETIFNTQSFNVTSLELFATDIDEMRGVSFQNVVKGQRQKAMMRIGARYDNTARAFNDTYGDKTYLDIVSDDNFVDNRLHIDRTYIANTDITPDKGPMVYVNYTIPGFILYRMVYRYQYTNTNPAGVVESFTLKSEIIDVSVPRKGSAEVYLSQDGIITHFNKPANPDYPFLIPGWGYHFYENVNLLQEIALGISGSKQKEAKRRQRGTAAMNALTIDAPARLMLQYIDEITRGVSSRIYGFFGALTHNVNDLSEFNNGVSVYNTQMIGELRTILIEEESQRFKTAIAGLADKDKINCFVSFRLNKTFDPALKTVDLIKAGFGTFLLEYNNAKFYELPTKGLNKNTYQFITPYENMKMGQVFPIDYGVINVLDTVFDALIDYCDTYHERWVKGRSLNAFILAIHCKGCVFYVIFQKCGAALPDKHIHLKELLQLSILESQRYGLAQAYEKS